MLPSILRQSIKVINYLYKTERIYGYVFKRVRRIYDRGGDKFIHLRLQIEFEIFSVHKSLQRKILCKSSTRKRTRTNQTAKFERAKVKARI